MGSETDTHVTIPVDGVTLDGELALPPDATGLVVFAHGSGSSRLSPRNTFVAERLQSGGLGTLLFDLLTEAEDETYETRFDVDLLTSRLLAATDWLRDRPDTASLALGYFGSSTGAAAALRAAADRGEDVSAVVSRGGRSPNEWVDLHLTDPAPDSWEVDVQVERGAVETVLLWLHADGLPGVVNSHLDDADDELVRRVLAYVVDPATLAPDE